MSKPRRFIVEFASAITAVCFVVGVGLILTGWLPIQIFGGVCLMLGFLMPFFRLPTQAERDRETAAKAETTAVDSPPRANRPTLAPSPPSIRERGTEPS